MTVIQTPPGFQGRHGEATPSSRIMGFTCVACGKPNTGPLELGCEFCKNGQPGQHVGVPPRAVPPSTPPVPHAATSVDEAFIRWRHIAGPFEGDFGHTRFMPLLLMAFKAGWEAGMASIAQTNLPLTGTTESRTIIAALRLFIESVLPNATDEINNGEFLSIPETEALITKLERSRG